MFDYITKMPEDSRLVITAKDYLVFMVANEGNPQIPGYPAWCIGGAKTIYECNEYVKEVYKRLGYYEKEYNGEIYKIS